MSLSDVAAWESVFEDSFGSNAGETVSATKALTISAIFQGVELISGDAAKIPLAPYRRTDGPFGPGSGKARATDHSSFALFHRSGCPNEETSSFEFWRRLFSQALIWGNAYAWLDWSPSGELLGAYNLLPDRTKPYRRTNGELWYVTEIDGDLEALRFRECLHVRRFGLDNSRGVSLLDAARHAMGKALAKEKYESRYFRNNASIGGILVAPEGAEKSAVDTAEQGFRKKYDGTDNAFRTAILRDGFKFIPTQADPRKSQLTDMDEIIVRTVARYLNLPPGRLGAQDSKSYASADAERRDYHDSTLSPWLESVAGECTLKLLSPDERRQGYFFEHQINALLWADAQTRSAIGIAGIQNGIYCPDEIRAMENLPPRPDGQGGVYLRPMNMEPASGPVVADPTPADSTPVETPPSDPTADARGAKGLALAWLRDAYGRATRRLDNVISRTSRTAAEWTAVAGELDAKHREALVEMFGPPAGACRAIGVDLDADVLANELLDGYRAGLLAGDRTPLARALATWESRYLPHELETT